MPETVDGEEPTGNTGTREELKNLAVALYLQGFSVAAVAEQVGVSRVAVNRWLQNMREIWVGDAMRRRVELIAEGLAKLSMVETAAWQRGDLGAVIKCVNMRFLVTGAYEVRIHTAAPPPDMWAVLSGEALEGPDPDELVEQDIARAAIPYTNGEHRNGHH